MATRDLIEKQLKDLERVGMTRPLDTQEVKNLDTLVRTLKTLTELADDTAEESEVDNATILRLLNGTE